MCRKEIFQICAEGSSFRATSPQPHQLPPTFAGLPIRPFDIEAEASEHYLIQARRQREFDPVLAKLRLRVASQPMSAPFTAGLGTRAL